MRARRSSWLPLLAFTLASSFLPGALFAAGLGCTPCGGLRTADPAGAAAVLAQGRPLPAEAKLVVAWDVELDGSADLAAAAALRASGAVPWMSLLFRTPSPLTGNLTALDAELAAAAAAARELGTGGFAQVLWQPAAAGEPSSAAVEYAYLLKRAAVAVTGAQPQARVATQPLPADAAALRQLYDQGIAAYLDAVALPPLAAGEQAAALAVLAELDPGQPVVVDALPYPDRPLEIPALAAERAAQGVALTFFAGPAPDLAPLVLLASEFAGDLSYDAASEPTGAVAAWTFVRGEDLGLRVVARPASAEEATYVDLRFPDPELRRPVRVDPATGATVPLAGGRDVNGRFAVRVLAPGPAAVLRLERPTAAELEGVEERLTVASERQLPVEEILRRLQATEDGQARRLRHYRATNTTHLRFRVGASSQAVEATFAGAFFFREGEGFDWAWQEFFVNGVRWRGRSIPEIPLVQPEKAAAMPLEIHFTPEYRYALRGSEVVDGRDTWVVEFEPPAGSEARHLHRGTVWIDRQVYARVRTRTSQLGLEGEVLSNEETVFHSPIDAGGAVAPWGAAEAFVLPLRVVGRQLLSVVNATTLVEKEVVLSAVRVNDADFDATRREVLASDATMVRDTAAGLRYLVKEEGADERVVKEGFDTDKLFAVGGVFYDDSLDFPLPLAGVNYFSFDFRGTGKQLNLFFAGALLTVNLADPALGKTRFDAGAEAFAIAVPFTDTPWRGDQEVTAESIETRPASVTLNLGHPLGDHVKLDLSYRLAALHYGTTDDTASGFRAPSDNQTHSFSLGARLDRAGYQLALRGGYHRRSTWEPWGFAGNPEYDPDHRDHLSWQATASKSFYFGGFQRLGLEVDYLGGSDFDRFSKYQFGFFGGSRVHGYQSNRVRAEEAWAGHLSYGWGLGDAFRLDVLADAALASDQPDDPAGLDRELLGGLGLAGTFVGPWQTVVNLDVGVPVAGPDDGFVAYIAVLKLFR